MKGLVSRQVSVTRRARRVLEDISIHVAPGELVALIGPNGAGKSTLLRTLAGASRPQHGQCLLDTLDVYRCTSSALARRRAVLPQAISTDLPLPVEDIVQLGRAPWRRHASPTTNHRAVNEAVRAVGVEPLLGRDYARLSGGERQRVQLARVLAQIWDVHWDDTARYLLLDEPTASLDIGHQQRLLSLVREVLPYGIGVLAVLHDLNLAATFADRLYLLHQGHFVTTGTAENVLQAPLLRRIYDAQLDVQRVGATGRPAILACYGRS